MNESDAIDYQLELHHFGRRMGSPEEWDHAMRHRLGLEPEQSDAIYKWAIGLGVAPIVLLGPELEHVIFSSLDRFVGLSIKPDDIPMPTGLVLFQQGQRDEALPVWDPDDGDWSEEVMGHRLGKAVGLGWRADTVAIGESPFAGVSAVVMRDMHGMPWPDYGDVTAPLGVKQVRSSPLLVALAVWTMMRDYLIRRRVGRKAARRARAAGLPPAAGADEHTVQWVTLRRERSAGRSGDAEVEWRHQWIVNGHWRNQWYPSVGEHRPRWIAPYMKGPEGAPLLTHDTHYRLVR